MENQTLAALKREDLVHLVESMNNMFDYSVTIACIDEDLSDRLYDIAWEFSEKLADEIALLGTLSSNKKSTASMLRMFPDEVIETLMKGE